MKRTTRKVAETRLPDKEQRQLTTQLREAEDKQLTYNVKLATIRLQLSKEVTKTKGARKKGTRR